MKPLLVICLLLSGLCQAQDVQDSVFNYTSKRVWRVSFTTPLGVTNELRLGPKTTLVTTAGLGGYAGAQATAPATNAAPDWYYGINANVSVGSRYFYNFERRLEGGKSIRYNSGNYLTVVASYTTPAFIRKDPTRPTDINTSIDGPSVRALWGFQRTYRQNFYLNLGLGLGVSRQYTGFAGDFALGYTFPDR